MDSSQNEDSDHGAANADLTTPELRISEQMLQQLQSDLAGIRRGQEAF